MRFNHLDLNLLVALDVLLEEQNITRAAERLHMTQSATSGVLGRLRTYFEDELLVQVGRKMQPTPFALELVHPVREVLLTIKSSITAKPVFAPTTSKRHFPPGDLGLPDQRAVCPGDSEDSPGSTEHHLRDVRCFW